MKFKGFAVIISSLILMNCQFDNENDNRAKNLRQLVNHLADYEIGEIYRSTFANQKDGLYSYILDESKIPPLFLNRKLIDVTNHYIHTSDVRVKLNTEPPQETEFAFLCVFDNQKWTAMNWAKIDKQSNSVYFQDMGRRIVYLPMYYQNHEYASAGYPFILDFKGNKHDLKPNFSSKANVTLTRKYPLSCFMIECAERMVGGRFQGSNSPDFKNVVDLYTVSRTPYRTQEVQLKNVKKFKYVRYLSPDSGRCNVGEIEFHTQNMKLSGKIIGTECLNGKGPENAFDDDIVTYVNSINFTAKAWVGLDLGEPKRISKIRYIPRNDGNIIEPGDTYQLLHFDLSGWTSLGEKVATEEQIQFENVPKDALLLLRNLTKGIEERIFTYEEKTQIWW